MGVDDKGDNISDDCESDSDGANSCYNFRKLLTAWAVTWGIKRNAVDALLAICRFLTGE